MTTRRAVILLLGTAVAPRKLFAQSKQPVLIGRLSWGRASESLRNGFTDGMAALGWREGSHYVLEERWAEGQMDRLPGLARELAEKKPALIIASPVPPARAAAKAAPMTRLRQEGIDALIAVGGPSTNRPHIVKFALARRWPLVGPVGWARDGALLSYDADYPAMYRRAAYYADRILKGARPADLPIERPTKFELVINMKTAKALGITIPQSVLVQATRVIE